MHLKCLSILVKYGNICLLWTFVGSFKFNPILTGGGVNLTPLHEFRDRSAAQNFLTGRLADFLLLSLAQLLRLFSQKSGVRLIRRRATFCTCMSDRKWLKNVILCTKSMEIIISVRIHKDIDIFTFMGGN